MKNSRLNKMVAGLILASLTMISLQAQEGWTRYDAQFSGSTVRMEGTSTIHDWHAEGKIIGGTLEFDSTFPTKAGAPLPEKLGATPKVHAVIPVTTLKSSSGKLMDDVMYKAMDQKNHSRIEYRLTEMTPNAEASKDGALVFDTKGELAVAGKTNVISMPVTVTHMEDNKLKVVGTSALKMTDFGIQPPAPKLALGAIKTGDDITVTFEWIAVNKTAK
jgi:hypothetical protein